MNVFIMRSLQARAKCEIAHSLEAAAHLRKKLQRVLQQEADLLDLLTLAEQQVELVAQYAPFVAGRYRCPCCATVSPVGSELVELTAEQGVRRFQCLACEQDFQFDLSQPPTRMRSQLRESRRAQ